MPNTARRPDDDRRRWEAQRRRQRRGNAGSTHQPGTAGRHHAWSASPSWAPWIFPSCF